MVELLVCLICVIKSAWKRLFLCAFKPRTWCVKYGHCRQNTGPISPFHWVGKVINFFYNSLIWHRDWLLGRRFDMVPVLETLVMAASVLPLLVFLVHAPTPCKLSHFFLSFASAALLLSKLSKKPVTRFANEYNIFNEQNMLYPCFLTVTSYSHLMFDSRCLVFGLIWQHINR